MGTTKPKRGKAKNPPVLGPPGEHRLLPYVTNPIRLTDSQIDSLLARLGNPQEPSLRACLAKDIGKVAEYFLNDVEVQSAPTLGESLRRINRIRSAARKILRELNWHDGSTEAIPLVPVVVWLRQATSRCGDVVRMPRDLGDLPTNDLREYAVHRAAAGVRLMEELAREAEKIVEELLRERKDRKKERQPVRGKHALRVAVQRLAFCWYGACRKMPAMSFNADGPFFEFADAFFAAMRQSVTASQRSNHPGLTDKLLEPSRETIKKYLGALLSRLSRERQARERREVVDRKPVGSSGKNPL